MPLTIEQIHEEALRPQKELKNTVFDNLAEYLATHTDVYDGLKDVDQGPVIPSGELLKRFEQSQK